MKGSFAGGLVPAGVSALSQRIEAWRGARAHRNEGMPAQLWEQAVGLAQVYGVYQISQALNLGYEALKKRTAGNGSRPKRKSTQKAEFVEVVGLGGEGTGQIELEIESSGGARLRLRDGCGRVDVAEVIESFCRSMR
jgi:hypothetical protein